MQIPTEQSFTDAYQKAPRYVQDFIDGDELNKAFTDIRTTYKLHLDDSGILADILNAVILELIPLGQFEAMLAEHIPALNQEIRTKLTREVNEKIFAVLRARAEAPKPEPVAAPGVVPVPPATYNLQPTSSVVTQNLAGPTSEAPKTVVVPMPQQEPKYKTDPYREPIE